MAWYQSWNLEGLPVATALPYIMADVFNAVNERLTVTNASAVAWVTVGGTDTTPVASDFDGLEISDDSILANLATAQARIGSLLSGGTDGDGCYMHPDTPTTSAISVADMLDRGSYGSAWLTPDHPSDFRPWVQIKEVICEMLYVCWELKRDTGANGWERASWNNNSSISSWPMCVTQSPAAAVQLQLLWSRENWLGYGANDQSWIYEPGTSVILTSHIVGDLLAGWLAIDKHSYNSFVGPLSAVADGVTYTLSGDVAWVREEIAKGTSWPSLVSNPTAFSSYTAATASPEPGTSGHWTAYIEYAFYNKGTVLIGTRCVTDIEDELSFL